MGQCSGVTPRGRPLAKEALRDKEGVLWPLVTIGAGVMVAYLCGWLSVRTTAAWKQANPDAEHPFSRPLSRGVPLLEPLAWWLVPVLAVGSLGLVIGGLGWLALLIVT